MALPGVSDLHAPLSAFPGIMGCQARTQLNTMPSKGTKRYTWVPAEATSCPFDTPFNLPEGNYTLISQEEKQTPGIKLTRY